MPKVYKQLCMSAARSLICEAERTLSLAMILSPLSSQELYALSTLTFGQQQYLVERASQFMDVQIDIQKFRACLEELHDHQRRRALEDRYLELGAPLELMRRLFGLNAGEFSYRRRLLDQGGIGNGRPQSCSENDEQQAWRHWQQHSHLDEHQRFLKAAESSGLTLRQLWTSIKAYIDQDPIPCNRMPSITVTRPKASM
ncbi:STY4526/YPO1902 family pathogenicity island replication protein [Pseudoteredinibacter isoporae]|uniref:DUF2857 domain-containing protein n=1 Tax=Pseudoteredinibacter isoporae TaxID=570281 RepID=A0A7X0MYD4_9GAMM|nr:STY4526/YPO1902 family pathogenicity island replication protein [Pseudoteredinibacter isoporae]MBB6521897.1 hypothetical protein [Pseudoteredinibacter isoporae]NHO87441.1 DUF2857 family protein [Pseudoteredinibacter isoporae]NIB24228.1 DUF2857 family protein [Pseudoteredinibacter isoporae]